ncbi:thioesterase superfamily protein [Parvibaculum lavamentivorans DS-1]|uniref:Thioesterase superfamily protein n=1 Tax=Parvibaculum lavamentivorans (strain DS-1 / DSM 13023 / NCIMB 13966) TaxID=402881 RepID=A7HVF3_PARL1|nr:PaaI family thioesterase [Parvibaculum lavamentivorans]ABS63886.1 thioesterase superfamily protein [Parvibaculum lavamentivorans DS-1]
MTSEIHLDPPTEGFKRHFRQSPLTNPWGPLYSKNTGSAIHIGLWLAEPHTNSRGLAHGGLITALADNAMGLSCGLGIENIAGLVTVGLTVDFLSSARIGQWLEVQPEVVKTGSTLSFAQCLVTADDKACARANATFSVLKR